MKTKKNFFTLLIITVIAFLSVTGFYLKDKTSAEDIHTSINEDEKICIDKEDTLESKNDDIKSNKFEGLSLKDNSVGVPILYYHSIQKNGENELMMNPELFRSQMQWLKDNNYTSLTLEELYNYIKFNTPVPEKSVVITLDDGYVDNYTNAMPIINEFDFDATIFMVSDFINNPNFLTENQLKELEKIKLL